MRLELIIPASIVLGILIIGSVIAGTTYITLEAGKVKSAECGARGGMWISTSTVDLCIVNGRPV